MRLTSPLELLGIGIFGNSTSASRTSTVISGGASSSSYSCALRRSRSGVGILSDDAAGDAAADGLRRQTRIKFNSNILWHTPDDLLVLLLVVVSKKVFHFLVLLCLRVVFHGCWSCIPWNECAR